MRILHVVVAMNRGGVESWLMQILRSIDKSQFRFDFLVQWETPGDYDAEIIALGSQIYRVPPARDSMRQFIRGFRTLLAERGPYDVVHAHGGIRYAQLLRAAANAGVPGRIIHSHDLQEHRRRGLRKWLVNGRDGRMMHRYATVGLACSRDARAALFGANCEQDPRYRVLYYGIDLKPFAVEDRAAARAEFAIAPDDLVIGHTGRFEPVKNHTFLLDVADEIAKIRPGVKFLLIGDGSLRTTIQCLARTRKLDNVIFAGKRSDVPRIMSAMDLFVFPSLHEGFGLVVAEAQAAGIRCLVSQRVPKDVAIVDGLCRWMDLEAGPRQWALCLLKMAQAAPVDRKAALATVRGSVFSIEECVRTMSRIYADVAEPPQRGARGYSNEQ